MKKIIFFFTVILATAMIYGYSQSGQNGIAENNVEQAVPDDSKGVEKASVNESNTDVEHSKAVKAPGGRPGILYILTLDKSKSGGSTSFMRNYIYGNPKQAGC